jgi:hypothetical protein
VPSAVAFGESLCQAKSKRRAKAGRELQGGRAKLALRKKNFCAKSAQAGRSGFISFNPFKQESLQKNKDFLTTKTRRHQEKT